jgi:hypothetical protein
VGRRDGLSPANTDQRSVLRNGWHGSTWSGQRGCMLPQSLHMWVGQRRADGAGGSPALHSCGIGLRPVWETGNGWPMEHRPEVAPRRHCAVETCRVEGNLNGER